jgi:hypothetical protein
MVGVCTRREHGGSTDPSNNPTEYGMNKLILVLIASLFLPVIANAQGGSLKRACAADIKQNCAGVKPGRGRIAACVKEHFGQFSAPCQKKMITTARVVVRACKADAKQKCAGMSRPAEIASCFQQHFDELSASCKDVLVAAKSGRR